MEHWWDSQPSLLWISVFLVISFRAGVPLEFICTELWESLCTPSGRGSITVPSGSWLGELQLKMCWVRGSTHRPEITKPVLFLNPLLLRAGGNKISCFWLPSNKEVNHYWAKPLLDHPVAPCKAVKRSSAEVAKWRPIFLILLWLCEANQMGNKASGLANKVANWEVC